MDPADLRHGLIVSCQAHGDHPLRDPYVISLLAACAERGGAAGIRADGPTDVRSIRERVSLPIIGIHKVPLSRDRFFITPTFDHARRLARAGANIVALDATFENRPETGELGTLIHRIQDELKVAVMADVSTLEEGLRACESGADLVATTLSGYTPQSPPREDPDFDLVGDLADGGVRVVAEGRVRTPEQVRALFRRGAHSVVVGTAITDIMQITSWFVDGAKETGP